MKIGVIGFGNLGSAFAIGLIKQGMAQEDLLVSDPSERAIKKAHDLGINNTDIHTLIEKSELIVLAVKPTVYEALELDPQMFLGKTLLSFVAGVSMQQLAVRFGCEIVRAMPTIAMENLQSVTGLCFAVGVSKQQQVCDLFKQLGMVYTVDEDKLESITALASCGLGFAAYILDCFTKSGEYMGFCEEDAIKIISQTFSAAIDMGNFELLMGRVATKGGITQQGIQFMAEGNVNKLIDGAIKTAYAKASDYKK